MSGSVTDIARQAVRRVRPRSILTVGSGAPELIRPYVAAQGECCVTSVEAGDLVVSAERLARHDLAVTAGALEALEAVQAGIVVARLRDLLAPVTLVLLDTSRGRLGHNDMVGYGFERLAQDPPPSPRRALYLFAIDRYKTTPDWLNPRHWANPENWDKYRW